MKLVQIPIEELEEMEPACICMVASDPNESPDVYTWDGEEIMKSFRMSGQTGGMCAALEWFIGDMPTEQYEVLVLGEEHRICILKWPYE